jgi:methyl-accepting chemotaxis protein WspA
MSLNNLRFKSRMFLLVGVFLFGIAFNHVMYGIMLSILRVNGPVYQRIVFGKDVINSITPTNNNEGYMAALELLQETDPGKRAKLIKRLEKLEEEYEAWHNLLDKNLEEGPLRDALVTRCYVAGREFYRVVDEKVVAPLRAGKKPDEIPADVRTMLREQFDKRREVLTSAQRPAQKRIDQDEEGAQETFRFWIIVQAVLGVAGVAILLLLCWIVVRGIVAPTEKLIERMKDMAEGASDLTRRVEVNSQDEIGQLSGYINAVIQRIHDLIARVRVSTIQLNSTATEIAASAGEQQGTVQGFTASTSEIAAASNEISATSQELLRTTEDVRRKAEETSTLAESGRAGLVGMKGTMEQLAEATSSISAKLGTIREKAGGINVVVTTITKVADQTNLLSINAAIEAEKAGEAGRGFLVVAREIRRLADQTAVATLDIEQMVRHMQAAVSTGVMEMDKFSEQVRTCGTRVSEITGQMGEIIGQVQGLSDRFDAVHGGMAQQTQGAQQIGEGMVQLNTGVKQVGTSVREFTAAAENLRQSAQGLQQEVGQFTVAG